MAGDLYAVLGLTRGASETDIRSAHRRLVKELHPDLHPGDEGKAARFKAVSQAFEILGDAEQRAKYDRGEIDEKGNPSHPFMGAGGPRQGGAGPGGHDPFDDILSGLFGGGRGRRRTGPVKGRDVRYQCEISFDDAVNGARRRMSMADGRALEVDIPAGIEDGQTLRLKSQGHASPTGGPPGDAFLKISVQPSKIWTREGLDLRMTQPVSLATAVLGGKVDVRTPSGAVSLTVPAGSNTGTVLRLKGKGVQAGKAPGNLYARLEIVLEDPKDTRLQDFLRQTAE
ncbi:MAG: J domain-containing protein [Hyphomonadaceae bacterium]|nr:J domain-containing protein [Hyphomonadaceae bacterium]